MALVAGSSRSGVRLAPAILVLLSVLLPLHGVEAQTVRPNPFGNALPGPLPSSDEGLANIERQARLRGRASLPRERGQAGPLEQVPDAVRLGIIDPPKEVQPR